MAIDWLEVPFLQPRVAQVDSRSLAALVVGFEREDTPGERRRKISSIYCRRQTSTRQSSYSPALPHVVSVDRALPKEVFRERGDEVWRKFFLGDCFEFFERFGSGSGGSAASCGGLAFALPECSRLTRCRVRLR